MDHSQAYLSSLLPRRGAVDRLPLCSIIARNINASMAQTSCSAHAHTRTAVPESIPEHTNITSNGRRVKRHDCCVTHTCVRARERADSRTGLVSPYPLETIMRRCSSPSSHSGPSRFTVVSSLISSPGRTHARELTTSIRPPPPSSSLFESIFNSGRSHLTVVPAAEKSVLTSPFESAKVFRV